MARQDQFEELLAVSDRALATKFDEAIQVEISLRRAHAHEQTGKIATALDVYRTIIDNANAPLDAYLGCATAYRALGAISAARRTLETACDRWPESISAKNNLANVLIATHEYREGLDLLSQLASLHDKESAVLFNYGRAQVHCGLYQEATETLEKSLRLNPGFVDSSLLLAETFLTLGQRAHARRVLDETLRWSPDHADALYLLSESADSADQRSKLKAKIDSLVTLDPEPEAAVKLHFAAARIALAENDNENAWAQLSHGNALKRNELNLESIKHELDTTAVTLVPSTDERPDSELDSRLLLIVGMPRSGTTLIEQILAAHPQVVAGGEVDYWDAALADTAWERRLRGADDDGDAFTKVEIAQLLDGYQRALPPCGNTKVLVTDKTPMNFCHLAFLHRLLPNLRVVHCTRDPMATCWSIYSQLFSGGNSYAYDLIDIADAFNRYREILADLERLPELRLFEMRYETLVTNPEENAKQLLEFCNLEWHPNCAKPHEVNRPVHTASRHQVRQETHQNAIERWRLFEHHLEPLKNRLGYTK